MLSEPRWLWLLLLLLASDLIDCVRTRPEIAGAAAAGVCCRSAARYRVCRPALASRGFCAPIPACHSAPPQLLARQQRLVQPLLPSRSADTVKRNWLPYCTGVSGTAWTLSVVTKRRTIMALAGAYCVNRAVALVASKTGLGGRRAARVSCAHVACLVCCVRQAATTQTIVRSVTG